MCSLLQRLTCELSVQFMRRVLTVDKTVKEGEVFIKTIVLP